MRRPFTFLGSYAEESGGFPTLNGTLYDYWRSDLGVATSGGEVTIWTGQQNGYTFDQATTGGPTISGSNAGFNSIDTFTFNGSTSGLGHEGNAINGAITGDVQIAIYGAPHGDGGGWGAIFGVTTTGGSPFPSEAIMKARELRDEINDGKGIYVNGWFNDEWDDDVEEIDLVAEKASIEKSRNNFNKSLMNSISLER